VADQLRELLHINFPGSPYLGEVPRQLILINTNWQKYTFLLKNNFSFFTGDSLEKQSHELPNRDLFRFMVFHEPEKFCNHPSAPPCLGEARRRGTLVITILP
jgi:hypothetical protein